MFALVDSGRCFARNWNGARDANACSSTSLAARGGDVKFAAAEMPSQLVARLEAENVEVIRLGTDSSDIAPVGSEQDAIHTAKLAKQIGRDLGCSRRIRF